MTLTNFKQGKSDNFESIFFRPDNTFDIRVPDYQRAFTWEQKQIDQFIQDLVTYKNSIGEYYFGHFIAEEVNGGWDIVDGQQRLTTFVLFLMVCKTLLPTSTDNKAFSLIERFSTVSYDKEALRMIDANLKNFLTDPKNNLESSKLDDKQIICSLKLNEKDYTFSQRRMAQALHRFYRAFNVSKKLCKEEIESYIKVIMSAHCSRHLTADKSVAANIFEMQNTRGVPLTTIEIVKAKLMKFVYNNSNDNKEKDEKIEAIRKSFGSIYKMEEQLSSSSFRGDLSMENLLRLHLRVVADGNKKEALLFNSPAANASSDGIIDYIDLMLRYNNVEKTSQKEPTDGLEYAVNLAKEFEKTVRIACEILPEWDKVEPLVGDVLILERDISYQFFFIICRLFENEAGKADGRVGKEVLELWEKLLFTRDFHDGYYNLRDRDNFPALFAALFESFKPDVTSTSRIEPNEANVSATIKKYLKDGFRPEYRTKDLQKKVKQHLENHKDYILNRAYWWWKHKMIYAIYKYEIRKGADIRAVMKGTISVEHILPTEWQMDWIDKTSTSSQSLSEEEKEEWRKNINSYINGIGNLLLISPSQNTSNLNRHPKEKRYKINGGSYEEHDKYHEEWESPSKWHKLIGDRGEKIYDFMLNNLIYRFDNSSSTNTNILDA